MESQDICPYSPNISSCQTLNEENIRYQNYDLAVENKNEIQSSHGQSLIREQGRGDIHKSRMQNFGNLFSIRHYLF